MVELKGKWQSYNQQMLSVNTFPQWTRLLMVTLSVDIEISGILIFINTQGTVISKRA